MNFRHDGYDVWVFRRAATGIEYLLLRASRDKADRWFGGGQFWQIPSDFTGDKTITAAIEGELARYELSAQTIWAAEYTYTIYNRRYQDVVHLVVFAAEVSADAVRLDSGHAEYRWCNAEEAERLVAFRGLKEGLVWVRRYVTEAAEPLPELRLL